MISEVQKTFGCKITISTIFENLTVKSLAKAIEQSEQKEEDTLQIKPNLEEAYHSFPLTDVQYAYWLGRSGLYELGNVATHCYFELDADGLDTECAETAWNLLIQRHEELRLLIDSLLFSKHIPYSQAKELIKKLESLSNIYFKSCSQYIYPLPVERTDNKQVFYNIAILDDAIRKKKKVLFEYAEYHTDKKMHLKKREDGSVREYIITPYQMAVQEGKYYLICNYDKYDDISNYRVDRIRNIQILEEKGKPFETLKWSGHQPMNLNEYMKEHVYMYSSENAFVKFRIVKAMISDVIDLFGKGVNFSEETDTHVSVSVHVNERAVEQFAKNYAPDVVILQPKRLRGKLRDDLKKAWEAYED